MRHLSLFLAACSLTACIGEPYSRPDLAVPPQYRFALAQSQAPADTAWWPGFSDPALDALVTEALANNEDLRIAAARVDQFQGAKVTTRAPLFPAIGYTGSTGEESRSELVYGPGAGQARSFSSAGVTAGWELDVWGRVRNLTAAADADWRASCPRRARSTKWRQRRFRPCSNELRARRTRSRCWSVATRAPSRAAGR